MRNIYVRLISKSSEKKYQSISIISFIKKEVKMVTTIWTTKYMLRPVAHCSKGC